MRGERAWTVIVLRVWTEDEDVRVRVLVGDEHGVSTTSLAGSVADALAIVSDTLHRVTAPATATDTPGSTGTDARHDAPQTLPRRVADAPAGASDDGCDDPNRDGDADATPTGDRPRRP